MSKVVLMCGPAGAGKSTVARQLEADGMTRLSFDQEAWRRGIRSMPLPPELHAEIEAELRARLLDLVQGGVDVVLDFSFWSRRARMEYRELLRPWGVVPETVYLATPRAIALERMRTRGLEHGDDYALPDDLAAAYFDHFEPPTGDEGPLTVIGEESR
ncbi:AAA family ATPase [Leifsonia sp. 2MCAF36]|uniref:AAA family ATPase n=1 Tax=Leifsonia sp. 2MCAF36 TaxID=3232988 RepID=UPI003F95CBF9